MICGTDFIIEDFEAIWPLLAPRAARWMTAEILNDTRKNLETGPAVCLASADGLVVITLQASESGKMRAMVLLAVSTGRHGAFDRQEGSMLKIARDFGAEELAFHPRRTGWPRLLGPEWARSGEFFSRSV